MRILHDSDAFIVLALNQAPPDESFFIGAGSGSGKVKYLCNGAALRTFIFLACAGNIVCRNSPLFVCGSRKRNHRAAFVNEVLDFDNVAHRINIGVRGA